MPRTPRKPSNVVKSRSAPSLLGGFASGRQKQEFLSNRFIELGDIALGNPHRGDFHPRRKVEQELNQSEVVELPAPVEPKEIPKAKVLTRVPKPPKPAKLQLPKQQPPKPPRLQPAKRPKPPAAAILVRPKPPKPSLTLPPRPSLPPLPRKAAPPQPPRVVRPKPITGRLGKTSRGFR